MVSGGKVVLKGLTRLTHWQFSPSWRRYLCIISEYEDRKMVWPASYPICDIYTYVIFVSLVWMSVCMLALVNERGGVCSVLALSIWNGDTMSLLLVFDVISFVLLAFWIVLKCHHFWISESWHVTLGSLSLTLSAFSKMGESDNQSWPQVLQCGDGIGIRHRLEIYE